MMTGKSVKDVDRYQTVLNSLLALEENKFCADCESKGKCLYNLHVWKRPGHESPLLLVYYARKCGIAFISPRPITLYYGARHGAISSHGWSMAGSHIMPVCGVSIIRRNSLALTRNNQDIIMI